jgi:hypothetical protein
VKSRTPPGAKIGAHGLSMGGMVASYLARKGLVDFLFADRTFYDIQEVPVYSMGSWAKYAIKFLTLWRDLDSSEDFIFTNCYKVIAQDPNDEVINDNSSLKTGVSLHIIQNELKNRFLERTFEDDQDETLIVDMSKYHHILTEEETGILFKNLE